MVVEGGLKFAGLGDSEGLWNSGSKGALELCKDFKDRSLAEAYVLVDEVGEAVGVNSGVNLLDDHAFDLVAGIEDCYFFLLKAMSLCNMIGCHCRLGEVWEH